jgi:hypothetical protein
MPKGMDIEDWTITVILAVVLVAVLAYTIPTLLIQLSALNNATSKNPMTTVLLTLTPLLISAGVLILFVFVFIPTRHKK